VRRRLFTFFSALSLLLCLAVCGLWVRSYWHSDPIEHYYSFSADSWQTEWNSGGVTVSISEQLELGAPTGSPIEWRFAGFHRTRMNWAFATSFTVTRTDSVTVPHWFWLALAGIAPTVWLRAAIRRRRRTHAGLCRSCGYDLRATPDRCPECGRRAAAAGADGRIKTADYTDDADRN